MYDFRRNCIKVTRWTFLFPCLVKSVVCLQWPVEPEKKNGAGLIAPVCGREEGNRSGFERLPATLTGWGDGVVAGLASDTDGGELVTAAGSTGSAVAGQQPLSAIVSDASADLKRRRR